MSARKIKPEVLRPFLLVIAMLVALFVLQFLRPTPPDLRQEQLRKAYQTDLQTLYSAVRQYQDTFGALPADWADLRKTGLQVESLELPDLDPKHPVLEQTAAGTQVQNMPFALLRQGRAEFTGPRKPLIEFKGTKEATPATLYTDGTIEWTQTP